MQEVIIANHVWKKYMLGMPKNLTEAIPAFLFGEKHKTFWALKNISITIKKGETIGIIGLNGSGKSTLLKLLAGISFPTLGTIETKGRIVSLFELGTGFHPELTGQENIYLYGTIMGISLKQIDKKFSEIVRFSGIKKFLDTPLKHYSSGMYARLGITLALFSNPEIYLIDEVLVAGDIEFQEKALKKLKEMKSHGLTVVIVSHDLGLIDSFCERAILMDQGQISEVGLAKVVTAKYWRATHKGNL